MYMRYQTFSTYNALVKKTKNKCSLYSLLMKFAQKGKFSVGKYFLCYLVTVKSLDKDNYRDPAEYVKERSQLPYLWVL